MAYFRAPVTTFSSVMSGGLLLGESLICGHLGAAVGAAQDDALTAVRRGCKRGAATEATAAHLEGSYELC